LGLIMMTLLSGCATSRAVSTPAQEEVAGSAGGFFEEADAFQVMQEASGIEEASRHPVGAALSSDLARKLWSRVAKTPLTQKSFGPRLTFSWLLREVLASNERVEYAELLRRTERFWRLVVVRPDGYLVAALNGRPLQHMGRVELREGQFKTGRLVVGAFYTSRAGVLYPVDESLRRADTIPWAELGLERDWLNAALDGAEDAMGELALALAQSVLDPIRTLDGLKQLPDTVARLITSSPEYFARYGAMSLQDQIREAARLSTHLLMMYGGAAGTAGTVGRIGTLGVEVPVLALTAKGELVVSAGHGDDHTRRGSGRRLRPPHGHQRRQLASHGRTRPVGEGHLEHVRAGPRLPGPGDGCTQRLVLQGLPQWRMRGVRRV
jgi:hypothetical protein